MNARPTAAPGDEVDRADLLDRLPFPVLVVGRDLAILLANPAAEAFLEASARVLRRQRLPEVVGPASPLQALVESVRATGASASEYGFELASARLEPRTVDAHAQPVGEPRGAVAVTLVDRGMAQMMERQLDQRSRVRSVAGLSAMLAHEIKNPLSGIRGAAQLLAAGADEDSRALTELICAETDRIVALVDRVGSFADGVPPPMGPVNIHSVLGHVRQLAEAGFARGIRITETYDPSLPHVFGNRDRLIQAVLNLVKNAAEAAGGGREGRIGLSTAFRPGPRLVRPGGSARIGLPILVRIEDNGPGVSPAVREHLFEPFVTTKPRGTGLGLALVAKVVAEHGGVIELEERPGRTAFRLLLPVSERMEEAKP